MSVLDRVLNRRPAPLTAKAAAAPLALHIAADGKITAIKADGTGYAWGGAFGGYGSGAISSSLEGYARAVVASVWAMRCVEIRQQIIQRMGWKMVSKRSKQTLPNHPLMVAVNRAPQRLFRLHERSQLVFGETFLWPRRNASHYFSDLQRLNNLYVEVDTAPGYIRQFWYIPSGGGRQFTIPANRMAFIKTDNDFDDLRGLSRIESILLEIGIDRDIARTTRSFYQNDTRLGLILMLKNDIDNAQGEFLMDYWKANYQGPDKAGKPIILPFAVEDVKEIQRAPTVDDVELRESVRREICAGFGVPLSIAGAWDDAQYQSAPEQRKSLYEETIIPRCDEIKADWNQFVLPFFDESGAAELDYDPDVVLALTKNKKDEADTAAAMLTTGGITLNQYLEQMKLPPLGDKGEVFYVPTSVQVVPKAQLGGSAAPAIGVEKPPTPLLPATAQTDKAIGREVAIMLDLGNNTDLIGLQNRLKQAYTGGVEWNAPDTFHVTLAYAPVVEDERLEQLKAALAQLSVPTMTLNVGSLASFDNLGNHALHFRIRRNADLYALQAQVYNTLRSLGIETSAHSLPASYIPHVTMGYTSERPKAVTFKSPITVQPTALLIGVDQDTAARLPIGATPTSIHEKALDELRAWKVKCDNGKGAKFQTYLIREDVAAPLRAAIEAGDKAAIKAAFVLAREQVQVKAIDTVRSAFVSALRALFDEALAGNVDRRRFGTILRQHIRTYGYRAYVSGLQDGGVDDEPDESEQEEIAALVRAQSEYVTGVGEALYKNETVTPDMAAQKPEQWFNKSVEPFHAAGLVSANRNQMLRFDGPDGDESCGTCSTLKGQVHRAKDWNRKMLWPRRDTDNFECKGFECQHDLVPVAGKAVGNWL